MNVQYVADTNVVSELTKRIPRQSVVDWLLKHENETYLTSVTIEELWYGLERMPEGARKLRLAHVLESIVSYYGDRILPFDDSCGRICGYLHAQEILAGYTPTVEDLMIASIVVSQGATLVTRNIKDFERFPLDLVNPFT